MDYYVLEADGTIRPTKDVIEWARALEHAHRTIARDKHGDVEVSTVFLGIDHAFGQGPPLLFETMVFGGSYDDETRRYATREDALAGHAEVLKRVRRRLITLKPSGGVE